MTVAFRLTKGELRQRIVALARQLEVPEPDLADLRHYGEKHGLLTSAALLDSLG